MDMYGYTFLFKISMNFAINSSKKSMDGQSVSSNNSLEQHYELITSKKPMKYVQRIRNGFNIENGKFVAYNI